jgi:hypothetical protein
MLSFTKSEFPEVQEASLRIFEQLVSQGLPLSRASRTCLVDRVLAILKKGPEELFRPAALALAALVCRNEKQVSDHLLNQHPQTARLASSFAAKKQPGGRTMLDALNVLQGQLSWRHCFRPIQCGYGSFSG